MQSQLINFTAPSHSGRHMKFYGRGTFNLDWSIGHGLPAYGHVVRG
jgi:hypothetical protein